MEQNLKERIVELREQGLTYDEIAEQTGTYKSKIHRILSAVPNSQEEDGTEWNEEEQEDGTEWNDMEQEFETLRNNFGTLEQKVEQEIGTLQRNFETLQKNFEELQNKAGFMEQEDGTEWNEQKQEQETERMEQENGTELHQDKPTEAQILSMMSDNMRQDIRDFINYYEFALEQKHNFTKAHLEKMRNAGSGAIKLLISFLTPNPFEYQFLKSFTEIYFSIFVCQDTNGLGYLTQNPQEIDFEDKVDLFKKLRFQFIISI
ncbi:MAG: hypothetical protein MUC49_14020 [Raineya sp.]|jgi:hypothetical protein|nr:hypothetical protein [Raineya sp.]